LLKRAVQKTAELRIISRTATPAEVAMRAYKLISADTHIVERPDL
jgi:hypothetical protein